jgi:hypothetical protein
METEIRVRVGYLRKGARNTYWYTIYCESLDEALEHMAKLKAGESSMFVGDKVVSAAVQIQVRLQEWVPEKPVVQKGETDEQLRARLERITKEVTQ